ncbi:MAG: SlyX family protein [Mangrovicoccus sp.]|nr:SlyX family protein [Mangrovicoccus sp.]
MHVKLEEKLAYLERMVEDLSAVVARQDQELTSMARRVGMLMEREAAREAAESGAVTMADERPPHY